MNVYDFDNTIYRGDSSGHFCIYCFSRYPKTLLTLPKTAITFLRYKAGKCPLTQFKQQLFSFMRFLPNAESVIDKFWAKHEKNIKDWYLAQKSDDIIISASPEFLLTPVCGRLGVRLIASPVDIRTGTFSGLNCRDEEKVRRLDKQYPGTVIDNFYSDSYADTPLAKLAKNAYMVKGDKIEPWQWRE